MKFVFWTLPKYLIRISFYLVVVLMPMMGVWLASSLVAFINGPQLLAAFSGVLLFPLIPIFWDLRGRKRRTAGILTWGDRIALRTLALNMIFIVLLLAARPQTSFLALATRGDWFLEGLQGSQIQLVRQGLFKVANGLEWLYLAFQSNPYERYADTTSVYPTPTQAEGDSSSTDSPTETERPDPAADTALTETVATVWPWTHSGLHPAVMNMPPSAETSIPAVAEYIAQQESDPFLRVKALHDYVADRIAYDAESYFAGRYPPQDAETVFQSRKAVCAGYAKLLEALGQAIGEEIVYVVGQARTSTSDLSGEGHAWNAARIQEEWYLIDATWDSGVVDRSGFTKQYQSDYLLPPPQLMAVSHFPDDSAWQLLSQPLTLGEFLRQPMMRPRFFANNLELVTPTRSQTDTTGAATIQLKNPGQHWILASYVPKGSTQREQCGEGASQISPITCALPRPGTYEVSLFGGEEQYGQFEYLGQLEFNKS